MMGINIGGENGPRTIIATARYLIEQFNNLTEQSVTLYFFNNCETGYRAHCFTEYFASSGSYVHLKKTSTKNIRKWGKNVVLAGARTLASIFMVYTCNHCTTSAAATDLH